MKRPAAYVGRFSSTAIRFDCHVRHARRGRRAGGGIHVVGNNDSSALVAARRLRVGGTLVDLLPDGEFERRVDACLSGTSAGQLFVASVNLDHVYHFGSGTPQRDLFDIGRGAHEWLVLLDGMPLVRWLRLRTGIRWPQLAGSDLLPRLLEIAANHRATVGFLGGWADQHARLRDVLDRRCPQLAKVTFWSPTRDELLDVVGSAHYAREIRRSGVDVLIVGLGKPFQEQWLATHGHATGAVVAVCFGAAADFLSGAVPRAPRWMRQAGLEWAYRLGREPRRLGQRYLVQGPIAAWRVFRPQRRADILDEGMDTGLEVTS